MPQPLRSLCIALAALLAIDLAFLAHESFGIAPFDPLERHAMLVANSAAAAIALVFLGALLAFSQRIRFSRSFLQAFALANALVLISGSLLYDSPFQFDSLLDGLPVILQWVEAIVSAALAVALRRSNAALWFANGEPS